VATTTRARPAPVSQICQTAMPNALSVAPSAMVTGQEE
jgi:hypothetical protein